MEKYRNPHGQLKENLFLPLFNTNFISKSFGRPLQLPIWQHAGKGTRHFKRKFDLQILITPLYLQTLLEIINLISFLLSIFRPKNLCYKDDNYKILYVIKPNFCWIQLKTLQFDLQVCKSISKSRSNIRSVYNNTI